MYEVVTLYRNFSIRWTLKLSYGQWTYTITAYKRCYYFSSSFFGRAGMARVIFRWMMHHYSRTPPIYLMYTKETSLLVYMTRLDAVSLTTSNAKVCIHRHVLKSSSSEFAFPSLSWRAIRHDVSIDITYRVSQKANNDLSLAFLAVSYALWQLCTARVNLSSSISCICEKIERLRIHRSIFARIREYWIILVTTLINPISESVCCLRARKPPDEFYPSHLY